MLVIRLARTGRKKYPTYRIVAAESARAATSKFVAVLGHYNPHTKELVLKKDEAERYISNGAQPSNTVARLLKQEKVKLPDWVEVKSRNRSPKKETPVKTETAPAAAETTDETPAVERVAQSAEANTEQVEAEATTAPAEASGETAELTETVESDESVAQSAKDVASDADETSSDSDTEAKPDTK